ncbi:MAG: hypothetical protein CMJ35_12250 [Phycisphaerae bacterium]|nr:hypothetical protein [Phycisphaerae bacterium]
MSNEQQHPEHAQEAFLDALFEESPINLAALLRACADGELNEQQCERLKKVIADRPEAPSQHDFEQALRGCCSRAMDKPQCPKALRDRVTSMAATAVAADQDAYAQQIEDSNSTTRNRSFWARTPAMGIAAAVLLSVAGVLVWQSASIFGVLSPSTPLNIEQASYSERVGQFVLGEHKRCCNDDAAEAKLIQHDISQASAYFSQQFERPVRLPQMEENQEQIRFYGGGDCHVPETIQSGHLRFDAIDPNGEAISVSLFIAPDPGVLPLEEGVTYRLSSSACDAAGARLFVWVSGGVQYLLVSEASDKTCGDVRDLMDAPRRIKQI